MKTIERIKITKTDLQPSKTLEDAGYSIYIWKNEKGKEIECPLYALTSDMCESEQVALENLKTKLSPLFEAMPGNKYYLLNGETKIWQGEDSKGKKSYVAYERFCLPGLTIEQIRELMKVPRKEYLEEYILLPKDFLD
jgi:hypothetical protein